MTRAARVRIGWTVTGHGWAECTLDAPGAHAAFAVSHLGGGPEELLAAAGRIAAGLPDARAQFEAEPTAYRWLLRRDGADSVRLRVLELPDRGAPDAAGTELCSAAVDPGALARAVLRCFDAVAAERGEDGYAQAWGHPFPRGALEALRRLRRAGP